MNKTAGVLTTRKIKALLDSGKIPSISSRAQLAAALTTLGSPITVHGIDAWFKNNDSNYALARQTLDTNHRSYPIPKNRWSAILHLFRLDLEEIDQDDDLFRKNVFNEKRSVSSRTNGARRWSEIRPVVARCWDSSLETWVKNDYSSLDPSNYEFIDIRSGSPHSDWSVERVLASTSCGLLYVEDATLETQLVRDVLSFSKAEGFSLIILFDGPRTTDYVKNLGFETIQKTAVGDSPNRELNSFLKRFSTGSLAGDQRLPSLPETPLIAHQPSIAILPFADLTGSNEQQSLGLALAEDITTLLTRIPELFVISSSSTRAFYLTLPDSRTVRDQLGVRYVLEGSIRKTNIDKLRITAQLVDAVDRRGLWGERYDKSADHHSAVIDELSVAICAQLEPRIRLSHVSESADLASAPSWQLCQQGWMWLYVDAPLPKPERSLELFAKALELDPHYPLAHAGMAVALSTGVLWGGIPPMEVQAAKTHADQAYQSLPQNGASLYARAMVSFVQPCDLAVPLEYLKAAVEIEPSNAMYHAIYGYLLAHSGDTKEGLERCLFAMRLSPVDARETFLSYMLGNAQIANCLLYTSDAADE